MDSETFSSGVDYLGSSGVVFSVEQKACIQSSLVTLGKEQKFNRVKLWGTIRGLQKDYFIVHGVGKNELTDRKALYRYTVTVSVVVVVERHTLSALGNQIWDQASRLEDTPIFTYV